MAGRIEVGIAGWSYPDWRGIVYPHSKVDPLGYVSRFVDGVEINATFYRPPAQATTRVWLDTVSAMPAFFFTAKLHRSFTHEGRMDTCVVRDFHEGFEPMLKAGCLRHLLVQFRYDYGDTGVNRGHLAEIVKRFSEAFHLAVEVRHRSWQSPEALDFLRGLDVTVCNLDYPTSSNSFDLARCTVGTDGYFRLHGRNAQAWFSKTAGRDETYNYYYNEQELAQIKDRIDDLARAFRVLTVITNNHYRGAELANALELKALVTGLPQEVPEGLLQTYPGLARIAANRLLF